MIIGDVVERTFLHFSSWDKPFDSGTIDTTKAWVHSHYWTNKIATDEWCAAVEDQVGLLKFDLFKDLAPKMRRLKYSAELAKELVFEEVRRSEFSQRPSRRSCIFLFDESVDIESYNKSIFGNTGPRTLYRVELVSGRVHRATLSALNCNMSLHTDMVEKARLFWTHAQASMDTEVLFEGVCKMTRIVR